VATQRWKKFIDICSRFNTILACDGRTGGQTHLATAKSALTHAITHRAVKTNCKFHQSHRNYNSTRSSAVAERPRVLRVIECFAKSLEVIRNKSVEMSVCKSLSIPLKLCISYRFWDIQRQRMVDLETGVRVVQGHWKWRRSIDHIRLSIGPPL